MRVPTQGENKCPENRFVAIKAALCEAKVSAIVLAAGHSRRMGTLKPLLKLGDRTILERSISLFRELGIDDVIVVVGHRASEIMPLLQRCGAGAVFNEQFEQGMFSSVQAGIRAMGPNSQAFFLLPVDIPFVHPRTILRLLEAHYRGIGKVIIPVHLGKRGHPPLVNALYRDEILSFSGEGGLRAVFRKHENEVSELEVSDEMILFDLDTPSDYEALAARFR